MNLSKMTEDARVLDIAINNANNRGILPINDELARQAAAEFAASVVPLGVMLCVSALLVYEEIEDTDLIKHFR